MLKIKIPPEVQIILEVLAEQGFEAYTVGGCVRDSLLGRVPQDWDVCTSALPQQVMEAFKNCSVLETGLKHGTVTVLIDGKPIEVTTFRVEGNYSDHRRPDKVEFVRDLRQDLARRDFTVNAMAYNPKVGLIDCFNGLQDLREKVIRCVGEPEKRFYEDGLRVLRALRFASTFDFELEENTAQAIHRQKDLLVKVAVERIQAELNKLLCGPGVRGVLQQFADVLAVFIPEILPMIGFSQNNPYHIYDLWTHTLVSISQIPAKPIYRLTMLLHDLGKPACYTEDDKGIGHFYGHAKLSTEKAEKILCRLKYDRATIDAVVNLVQNHDLELIPNKKFLKRLLNKLGIDRCKQLLEVQKADSKAKHPDFEKECLTKIKEVECLLDEIIEQEECFSLKDLAVKGRDLLEIGMKEGPELGRTLNFLLQQVIEEKTENHRDKLLQLAKSFIEKQ